VITGHTAIFIDASHNRIAQIPALCDYATDSLTGSFPVNGLHCGMEYCDVSESLHPGAPHDLPGFITAPGDTDVLMVVVGIMLIGAVLAVGNLYLHLHTLPERMAHRSQKLQFEIVAVLGLLALFTHNHLFWVIGLFLAMVDLPDFGTPLRRIAGSVEKIAGLPLDDEATSLLDADPPHATAPDPDTKTDAAKSEVKSHA
jgi:hypothetical protein